MPETPNYGFEYETPQTKPGITLTGDIDGSAPILAEQVDSVISGIDTRVIAAEGAITILQAGSPNDTGWLSMGITLASGFVLVDSIYRQWGPVLSIRVVLERTGADITANSAGNVGGDPQLFTINDAALRPTNQRYTIARCTNTSGAVQLASTGSVNLVDLHANSSLATGNEIRLTDTYFVATFN